MGSIAVRGRARDGGIQREKDFWGERTKEVGGVKERNSKRGSRTT